MAATALYNVAMSPADAFAYTRGALQAAGVALVTEAAPAHIEFSLTRKDMETGSLDLVMPGRATISPSGEERSTVTISVDPAMQFVVYAIGLGLAAALFGSLFLGSLGGLWFVLVLGAEAYLFWSIFNKWPGDALDAIRTRMQASPSVSGGAPIVQPASAIFTPPFAARPPANAADIAEQIRHLAQLRDQGHLTQQEFDAKKAELLQRI